MESDPDYRYYMYLIQNCDNFDDYIKKNVEIVSKIPKILEIISQEIGVAESMLFLCQNRNFQFEILKSNKHALNYFNYLRNNVLYDVYCKNCLDMNISDLKNSYIYELNIEKAPVYRHELFKEYLLNEVDKYIKILANIQKINAM